MQGIGAGGQNAAGRIRRGWEGSERALDVPNTLVRELGRCYEGYKLATRRRRVLEPSHTASIMFSGPVL